MLNLAQIQHHNRHSKREGYGFLLLCFYLSEVAFALGKAELPLDFNALILVEISLSPVTLFILLRSAQSRTAEPDPVQLAVAEILAIAVNLIRQYSLRVVSLSCSETLNCFNQLRGFVVGIE